MKKIPLKNIAEAVQEPGLTGNFSIRRVADFLSGRDMVQELHRHSFYYMLILEKGAGHHSIDFISYPVKDRTVFFMRPGQVHELLLEKDSTGYLVAFTGEFYAPAENAARQVLKRISNMNYCPFAAERFDKLLVILESLFGEYTDKQEKYLDVIQSGLNIFFIELLRQSCSPAKTSDSKDLYVQEQMEKLRELVEQHFAAHKQVAFYAGSLNLTAYQLNAITRNALGKTSSEVINDYILLEAKRYLLATANQVNQVAWHLGYEDVSYFIRFFKKHTGYTPEAFREKFR